VVIPLSQNPCAEIMIQLLSTTDYRDTAVHFALLLLLLLASLQLHKPKRK